MAAIPLKDINRAIVVKGPRKSAYYFKRASFPKGATPPHLTGYVDKFKEAAKDCKGVMAGMKGNEAVEAFNACIGAKLK